MSVGRMLMVGGVLFLVLGALWTAGEKAGLGRLPGDIVVRGERSTFYFPLATSLVLSLVLTVLLNLIVWVLQRNGR